MSTKHGRHRQGLTLKKWLNFSVDRKTDVDQFYHLMLCILRTIGRARNLIWGYIYVLTSHCNFKTC